MHDLLIKLMKHNLPLCFLEIIEHWLNICHSVVKWNSVLSYAFVVKFGVRQGSVLLPFLFTVYVDDIWVNRQLIPNYYVMPTISYLFHRPFVNFSVYLTFANANLCG